MDDELLESVEHEARKHALFNALKHDGTADVGAVMGPLMGENPAFRPHGDEIPQVVARVVASVNDLDHTEQLAQLEEIDQELVAELTTEHEDDERGLPALPNIEGVSQVRMRLAPNPNAPYHLGHARMPAVIGTYKDRYDGWMLCRFDDTDPETKRPQIDAYDAILEDIEYLGFTPDDVLIASDRLEIYYDHARQLIDVDGAYTCSCPAESFSRLKAKGEACPHREKSRDTVHDEFDAMVDGSYDAGEMVLRVSTDLEHPNPAVRDWVAFRMVDTPHPREEARSYRCWPMLDFQSAIDDYLTEVTHIIRGIDLQDSARRQRFVYDRFGWTYPEVIHWGHVEVDEYDVPLSASKITALIENGDLNGWDDPRAPTIASLRRRGIRGEAITDAMIELGTSTTNVELAMSWIYSRNRELIDGSADRYFLVTDPVEFDTVDVPPYGHPPRHPEFPDRGDRELPAESGVLLDREDVPERGERVWLKGLGCVERSADTLALTDDEIDVVREGSVPVVHWVPAVDNHPVELRRPDGTVDGLAESGITEVAVDTVFQFERVGFARIDEQGETTVAYFSHR